MRSLDGGASWTMLEASPALASYPFCSQSQGGVIQTPMAFGRNGTLYMASGGWDDQDGARASGAIVLSRSTNLGDTWDSTLVYNARGKTGDAAENVRPAQGLVVDTKHGSDDIVAVSFNLTKPNAAGAQRRADPTDAGGVPRRRADFGAPADLSAGQFDAAPVRQQALTSRTTVTLAPGATTTSTTAPAAGSRAAQPDQAANFGGSNARLAIDGKGTIYALWQSAASNITPAPPAARFLSKSTDGGKTWLTTQTMPFAYENAAAALRREPQGRHAHRLPAQPEARPERLRRGVPPGVDRWRQDLERPQGPERRHREGHVRPGHPQHQRGPQRAGRRRVVGHPE